MLAILGNTKSQGFTLIVCSVEEEERNGGLRALYTRLLGMVALISAGGKACPIYS